MTRSILKSVLAGAMLLGVATAAFAATGEYDNMCTMGLALGKDIKTDCSINATFQGKMYCFGNEDAKTMFMKDPAAQSRQGAGLLFEQEAVARDLWRTAPPRSGPSRRPAVLCGDEAGKRVACRGIGVAVDPLLPVVALKGLDHFLKSLP